jgi:hypothetical protein
VRPVAWKIKVTAERQLWQWQGKPMWTGSAEVHVGDGLTVRRNFFAYGGNPQPSRKEALRFAYLAALARLRAEHGRRLAEHAGGVAVRQGESVPTVGFEPTTNGLQNRCSTN